MQIRPSHISTQSQNLTPKRVPPKPTSDSVLQSFEDNFDVWDRDQNGQISWSEMRTNLGESSIKGEDAVSLATFFSLMNHDAEFRGLERRPPVSFDRMYDVFYEYDAEENPETGEYDPLALALYQKYQKKFSEVSPELFPQTLPNGFMGHQGSAPSCGFLAITFDQATKNPATILNAISETEDGQYSVKFPGLEKPLVIDPPTDTETILGATARDNGRWLNTLEKAWGTHLAKTNPGAPMEQSTYPEEAIRAWTNGTADTIRVPKNPAPHEEGTLPRYLRTTFKELAAAHTVVAWTRFQDVERQHFVPGHAYTVTGIDYEDGTISMRNPWGRLEPSNSQGEAKDGLDDGIFEMPLKDFHKKFMRIARQTS